MENNTLLTAALVGVGIYLATKSSSPSGPGYGTHVPPGYTYGGMPNNSGASIYVNLAGQIFNTLGQLIGNILDYQGSQGYTGGNANPDSGQGHWQDVNGEYTWVPNVGRAKVNCVELPEESFLTPTAESQRICISGF